MKDEAMVHEMWVDGHPVEIDAAELSVIDLADLHQGFTECPGCHDCYVLIERKYCAGCQRLHRQLEDKRVHMEVPGRINVGVVPFEALDRQALPSNAACLAILGGILIVACFTMTGMWYVGRGLVGFCLEKGW